MLKDHLASALSKLAVRAGLPSARWDGLTQVGAQLGVEDALAAAMETR